MSAAATTERESLPHQIYEDVKGTVESGIRTVTGKDAQKIASLASLAGLLTAGVNMASFGLLPGSVAGGLKLASMAGVAGLGMRAVDTLMGDDSPKPKTET